MNLTDDYEPEERRCPLSEPHRGHSWRSVQQGGPYRCPGLSENTQPITGRTLEENAITAKDIEVSAIQGLTILGGVVSGDHFTQAVGPNLDISAAEPIAIYVAKLHSAVYWTGPFPSHDAAYAWIKTQPTYRAGFTIAILEKP